VGGSLGLGSIALTIAARGYGHHTPIAAWGAKLSAFLLTYLLFFVIYRVIPGAPVRTIVALKAAFWGSAAWETAKYGFVVKLAQMDLQTFYGPLALSVSLVLWAYISSLVLVFGALMTPVDKRN
jgi:membrane protein/epoxyqueuosine reductase